MPIETAADLSGNFFSLNDFAVTALYSQNYGQQVPINGIFDRQFMALDTGDGAVTGVSVTFTCRADDLVALLHGKARQVDQLTVDGERWRVVEPQADGTGMVLLVLQKDTP